MKKKLLSLVLFSVLICISTLPGIAQEAERNPETVDKRIIALKTFMDSFLNAVAIQDQSKVEESVRQAGPSTVYFTILTYIHEMWIKQLAEGKDIDSGDIVMIAEHITRVYEKVYNRDGLMNLIKQYMSYDQEMCREKLLSENVFEEGNLLFSKGLLEDALSKWNEALKTFDKIDDSVYKAKIFTNKGIYYLKRGQNSKSIDYFMQSLEVSRMIGDMDTEVRALIEIGNISQELNQYANSTDYYKQSIETFRIIGNMDVEAEALFKIGVNYANLGQLTKTIEYFKQSLEIYRKLGDEANEVRVLGGIAKVYKQLDLYTEAIKYYKDSIELGRKIEDMSYVSNSLTILAGLYNNLGQLIKALNYYKQSLDISQQLYDKDGEAVNLGNIGNTYSDLGQHTKAHDYYNQALELYQKMGAKEKEAIVLMNIGKDYANRNKYSDALGYYHRALKIGQIINDETIKGKARGKIAHVFLKLSENYEQKDINKINEHVKQTEPSVLYTIVISYITYGIKNVADGKDGSTYFDDAESIAKIFARSFKKEALYKLVKRYRSYDQRKCKEKLQGDSLLNEGLAYYYNDQLDEALKKSNKALQLFGKIGDLHSQIKILMNMGAIYSRKRQYTEGLDYFKQGLEISRKIGNFDVEAGALANIGGSHAKLGQGSEAVNYYRQALELVRQIGDVASEAQALMNIGNLYKSIDQYKEALNYYKQILDLDRQAEGVATDVETLLNVGDIHSRFGQYAEALRYYKKAHEMGRKTKKEAHEAVMLSRIGSVYIALGQYKEALNYYQKALTISRKIHNENIEAGVLADIGLIYQELGQYTKALNYYERVVKLSQKTNNIHTEASARTNVGIIYMNLGKHAEALNYYQKSLEIDQRIGALDSEAKDHANIGWLYIELGQYNKGIEHIRESLKISKKLGEIETVWKGQNMLGKALRKAGKGEEAANFFNKAINKIEEMYRNTKGLREEERSSMIEKTSSVYHMYLDLLLELHKHKKSPDKEYDKQAFTLTEQAKSRVFQNLIAKAGAKTVFTGDDAFKILVEKEGNLIAKNTYLQSRLTKELSNPEKDKEVIQALQEQLAKAENAFRENEREIDSKYPRYADLRTPKSISVNELQEILKPDEVLLSYSLGIKKSVAFVVGRDKFKLIEIEVGQEQIAKLISEFRKGLDRLVTPDGHEKRFSDLKDLDPTLLEQFDPVVSYTLYKKIFLPVIRELKGVTTLYISGDNLLYTLPFEALVDKEIDVKAFEEAKKQGAYLGEYSTLHYLIDNTYIITYLPSASVLRSLRKYEKPGYGHWKKPLIVFADPIFSSEEGSAREGQDIKGKGIKRKGTTKETAFTAELLMRSTGSGELDRLEDSAEEARAIAQEVKGKEEDIYLREKATEENVYLANSKGDLKGARYLLFSTHGLLGGDFSGVAEPALALTLVDNPVGRDGFLTMSEVLGLDLNAELVILSACNTYGQGDKAGSGEGFAGLTRSFMYAGTKSILVTHWSVESQAARDLMVDMFQAGEKGVSPEALKKAKLKMKNSSRSTGENTGVELSLSHPFFWAPFVLVGEGGL